MAKVSVEEARRQWCEAEMFERLCALTAGFIAGEVPFFPTWTAPTVDKETSPLRDYLVAFNRAGFLTLVSQPGEPFRPGFDGHCWGQRAFVCGLAQEPVAARIERLTLRTDLQITVYRPGAAGGYRTPVVARGSRACMWVGDAFFSELAHFEDCCNRRAMKTLRAACCVSVVDLCWGRREHLWSILAEALCPPWTPEHEAR
jgi:hypothetical protein